MHPGTKTAKLQFASFWIPFLHLKSHPRKNLVFDDTWRSLCSFLFHFSCILDRFRCQIRNCYLVRCFRRFPKTRASIWICRSPLGAAVAPRPYNRYDFLTPKASKVEPEKIQNGLQNRSQQKQKVTRK